MADIGMFLPKKIIDLIARSDSANPSTVEEGTVVFCDVAGFTPLTEALSGIGKEGAEKLTGILNAYFAEMITIVDSSGGDVIRFGGDAMTIFFPKGLERNAAAASHAMMRKMDDLGEIRAGGKDFSLAMKIGVAYGKVLFGVVGVEGGGMDYYAAGDPLDDSAEAEHLASKGMIILHPTFRNICGGSLKELGGGFAESIAHEDKGEIQAPVRERTVKASDSKMARLVPRYLLERAGEGTLGEHRGTAVIFLGMEGLSPGGTEESAGRFQRDINRLFLHLAASAMNYGGTINKVDMGDKGAKAILLFGSPYALENKEEMAVRCAVELRDNNPMKGAVTLRAGITSSTLFTGPVGSAVRREFTVMGDGINTAARLMQKASAGDIFCDSNIAAATAGSVQFRELEPLSLKGKEKPVLVFSPKGFTGRDGRFEFPVIIEREDALERIKSLLMGKTKPLLITGEAGAGKTVLIEWARRESIALDITTTRIFLAPYHRTRAYSLWRGALRSLIGAGKEDSPDKVRGLRDAILDKGSREYGALMDPILGLEGEDGGSFGSLSPRERKELTFAVTEKLIHGGGERLILADNLEWADPLSLDLLNFLYQGGSDLPVKFMASCRSVSADLEKVTDHFDCHSLQMFSDEGTSSHLHLNLRLETVSQNLLGWFRSKADGNPKLIGAMFQILKEKSILAAEGEKYSVDEDRLFSTPFPEKLEDIYLGKIDELPREEREIVQAASVLGYSVSLFLLSMASDVRLEDARREAESLASKGIFRNDSWGERPYFRFADNLLRDAVYNALPFSLKRDAHLKCATFLEKEEAGKPGLYPVIAGHYSGAGDTERANLYNKKSAADALGRFDNLTAMRFLEEVLREPFTVANVDCYFNLVEVYGNLGRPGEEMDLISRLEKIENELEPVDRLRLLSFQTKKSIMERNFERSEKLFILSEKLAQKIGDVGALGKIYVNMAGGFYGPSGDLKKAGAALDKCLALPDTSDSAISKVTAMFNSANIMKHIGLTEDALATFKQAYKKARSLKHLPQMANIAQSIANLQCSNGRYRDALVWAGRTGKWAEPFGLRQLLLLNTHLTGLVKHNLGNNSDALGILVRNVEKAGRFANPYVQMISRQALIDVCFSLLEVDAALIHANAALDAAKINNASLTFRNTLVEVLKVFEAMDAVEEAQKFMEDCDSETFLRESPASPSIEPLLDTYLSWTRGKDQVFSEVLADALGPDAGLDYILFFLDVAARKNNAGEVSSLLEKAILRIEGSPSVSFKVRLIFHILQSEPPRGGSSADGIMRILNNRPWGVFGMRAMALAWKSEKRGTMSGRMRRRVIADIYRFRATSPEWAFKKLISFREIMDLLRGDI